MFNYIVEMCTSRLAQMDISPLEVHLQSMFTTHSHIIFPPLGRIMSPVTMVVMEVTITVVTHPTSAIQ